MKVFDIKEFTEKKEKLNGVYEESLKNIKLPVELIGKFFNTVNDIFNNKLPNWNDGEPIDLYKIILEKSYYDLLKMRRNAISKWNKKVIKNRGNIIWDSSKGTYRNDQK